jgi:histidyl-tRNA synthetase
MDEVTQTDDSSASRPQSEARVQPRTLKGFRDYLPDVMLPREHLMETARRVFRSYGFLPIDTPALEYLDILQGKGGQESDKQLYRFQDHGGRWVGLRFDLTVPLARFVAQHLSELALPFKRYHIGPVWRGENTQRGRYREFVQCDFDILGVDAPSADVETALVIDDLLRALGIFRFTIRMNNRMILNGWLQQHGLQEQATTVLRWLDKLAKIGAAAVHRELQDSAGLSSQQATALLEFVTLKGGNHEILQGMEQATRGNPLAEAGIARLREIVAAFGAATGTSSRLCIDPSIARGLDYYTGPVFETFLEDLPSIGSVCSGGRYDDLASVYCSQRIPGVGASLGLDRLLAALEELQLIDKNSAAAPVMIVYFEQAFYHDYLRIAARLRREGIGVELYPEPKKLAAQLKYADRRGFRFVLIAGTEEFQAARCQIKDMRTGQQSFCSLAEDAIELVNVLKQLLS